MNNGIKVYSGIINSQYNKDIKKPNSKKSGFDLYKNQAVKNPVKAIHNEDGDTLSISLNALSAYQQHMLVRNPIHTNTRALTKEDFETKINQDIKSIKLPKDVIMKGSIYLAPYGSNEYRAISSLAEEAFVCIPDKKTAVNIFKKQYDSIEKNNDDAVFVLNPSDPIKNQAKNIGTSNIYMTEWYKEINGIENNILSRENIQKEIDNCPLDEITIIVPDDCAITGRSMVMDTIRTLNSVEFPEDKSLNLIYSPMIASTTAQSAFRAMQNFDTDALFATGILNDRDKKDVNEFFEKYSDKLNIQTTKNIIQTRPYYETEYFKNLKNTNPELAEKVENIITRNRTANGFGRPGTSGVMIATPKADGKTLKCPNNNVYGATPYALLMGATPETIKPSGHQIDGEKTSPAKWRVILKNIQNELFI